MLTRIKDIVRRWGKPVEPSPEAMEMHRQVRDELAPRVRRVVEDNRRLLDENNYTARIRALYQ